jgi:enolase
MNNLTLQQMESLDIGKWMSDVEKEKAIAKALKLQAQSLEITNEVVKKKTLEETLRDGGLFTYTLGKKKYKLNVLTKDDLAVLDNIENDIEAGIEYDIPKAYRYHIRNGHDNYVTVRAKSYEEAQQVVDSIYGIGLYSISASNL